MKHPFLLLLLAVSLFACDPKTGIDAGEKLPTETSVINPPTLITDAEAAVPLSALTVADSVLMIPGRKDGPEGKITISTVLPHAEREELNQLVQTYLGQLMGGEEVSGMITNLEQELRTSIRNKLKHYGKQEITDTASIMESPYSYTYVFDYKTEVVYNAKGILSLSTFEYQNTGGAHPSYATSLRSFTIQPVRELNLANVFTADGVTKLTELINGTIDRDRLYNPDEIVEPTDNFVLTETGIRFHYSPYELGPYAAGEFDLEFTFGELEGLMVESENW